MLIARSGETLAQVSREDICARLRSDGFLILRGFAPVPSTLIELTDRFTSTYFMGYGRSPFALQPAITTVNESMLALEPHCDNGVRPEAVRPQITWFWCKRPATEGGETTFFDGIEVWSRLAPSSRAIFERHKVVFTSTVAAAAWRALGHTTIASFIAFLPTIGARGVVRGDSVDVEIPTDATRTPRWSSATAFVSSLLVAGSPGFEAMRVALDDGSPVPPDVLADLRVVLGACIEEVTWQAGDIGILDNTRFLHGRRSYCDAERRLFLVQTLHAAF